MSALARRAMQTRTRRGRSAVRTRRRLAPKRNVKRAEAPKRRMSAKTRSPQRQTSPCPPRAEAHRPKHQSMGADRQNTHLDARLNAFKRGLAPLPTLHPSSGRQRDTRACSPSSRRSAKTMTYSERRRRGFATREAPGSTTRRCSWQTPRRRSENSYDSDMWAAKVAVCLQAISSALCAQSCSTRRRHRGTSTSALWSGTRTGLGTATQTVRLATSIPRPI